MILIEHVRKYFLGILEPLSHFSISTFKCGSEREITSLSLLVNIGNHLIFRRKQNFSFVIKVNLNDLITKPKHNGVPSFHPFLYINKTLLLRALIKLVEVGLIALISITLQVPSKVL